MAKSDVGVPCVVVLNHKGGVGKTTVTILLAEFAAIRKRQRVLVVDWDGQMNLTRSYVDVEVVTGVGSMPEPNPIVVEVLKEEPSLSSKFQVRSTVTDIFLDKEVKPYPTHINLGDDPDDEDAPRVDLVAGNEEAFKLLLESSPTEFVGGPYEALAHYNTSQIIDGFVRFVTDPDIKEQYDLILLDTGPTNSPLFNAALNAATHVFCPYVPGEKSVSGIPALIEAVRRAMINRTKKSLRPEPLKFIGIGPNMVETRNPGHLDWLRKVQEDASEYHIPKNLMLKKLKAYEEFTNAPLKRPKPYSLFFEKPSFPARKEAEAYLEHLWKEVFEEA